MWQWRISSCEGNKMLKWMSKERVLVPFLGALAEL
jgi:hypothetical protein